jgi:hypothetical protein
MHSCRTNAPERVRNLLLSSAFHLQNEVSWEWAMLGSNQRPLPCEGKAFLLQAFAVVQKHLQNHVFASGTIRTCSLLIVWVGVLLV